MVTISSDLWRGAEIEIDGAFVGSTPSSNKLHAGCAQDYREAWGERLVERPECSAWRQRQCQRHP